MGRAIWRYPAESAVQQVCTPNSVGPDHFAGVGIDESGSATRKGYFNLSEPASTPVSLFKTMSKPLRSPIFPLPNHQDVPRQIGFFIALAGDSEAQALLRLEIQGTTVMYHAGLPVLPRAAYWMDRFGNLVAIVHLPPQGATSYREMYISPFTGKDPTAATPNSNSLAFPSNILQKPDGIASVLNQFLDHTIKLVSALEVRFI